MLQLKIGHRVFQGWTSARITRGLRQAAATFQLELTDKWDGKPWQVKPYERCEVVYDGEKVITGRIDSASVSYDDESHTVSVSGRSLTAVLVDCSAPSKQFRNQSIEAIAAALAKPFGVAVVTQVGTGKPIRSWKPDEGVTVFEAIEKLARLRGLLLTDDAAGNLVITRAGNGRIGTALIYGKNIKGGAAVFDVRDRFSEYTVKAQQKGGDNVDAVSAAHVVTKVTDESVPYYRPLVITAEDQADIETTKTRANWEKNARIGQSQAFSITVQGWQHDSGLWEPNKETRVTDKLLGVDADLLISQVTFSISGSGTESALELAPKEAFLPEPISPDSDTVSGKKTPVIWKELSNVTESD
jgi:prophage tail gpP-like protein